MSDINKLLPANASELEKAIEQSMDIYSLPVQVANNPNTAPLSFLPFLAQGFSVDNWAESLTESEKRAMINNSVEVHKYKGTVYAVKKALSSVFDNTEIIEFKDDRIFEFDAKLTLKADTETVYDANKFTLARSLINSAKNARSRFINFDIEMPSAIVNIYHTAATNIKLEMSSEFTLAGTAHHHIQTALIWKLSIKSA